MSLCDRAKAVAKRIEESVKFTCDLEGITLVKNKDVDMFGRSYCIAIPDATYRYIWNVVFYTRKDEQFIFNFV